MGKYIKGMSKDTGHLDQPEGTWRYARNVQIHPITGVVSNEHGMKALPAPSKPNIVNLNVLNEGAVVIGAIEITDDRVILFIRYNIRWTPSEFYEEYQEEIGLFENETYTVLYRPNKLNDNTTVALTGTDLRLNFNLDNFIEGTYKINAEEELFVYWVDDLNPPRAMNITRQKEWIDNPGAINRPEERLYGLDPETTTNPHHIRMLDLFPSSGPVPHVEFGSINPGGNLLTGVYFLALSYVDRDLVSTNYVTLTNPVSIVEDVEGVLPIERYDGAPAAVPSGKAISWNVSNLNSDYEYLRPVVIRKADGKRTTFKLNDLPIKDTDGNISLESVIFTGLEGFNGFDSVEDVIVDTASYESAKTINQLDGSLYLGNVRGTRDVGYQPYANFITSRPAMHPFPYFDPHEATLDVLEFGYIESNPRNLQATGVESRVQGYRHNKNIYKYKGYTRDEVYAFYIAFLLEDGTESYAYHIPGREPLKLNSYIEGDFQYNRVPTYTYDSSIFDVGSDIWESGDIYPSDPGHALNQITNTKGRIFHFFETSMLVGSRNMNYWQNFNEFYPTDELNASNWDVLNASWPDRGALRSLAGKRVRHHHFPSNENATYQSIHSNTSTIVVTLDIKEVYAIDFDWCSSKIKDLSFDFASEGDKIVGKLAQIYGADSEDNIPEVANVLGIPEFNNDNAQDELDSENNRQTFMFYEMYYAAGSVFPNIGDDISFNWVNKNKPDAKAGSYASNTSADSNQSPYYDGDPMIDGLMDTNPNDDYSSATYGNEHYFVQSRPDNHRDIDSASDCDKDYNWTQGDGNKYFSTGCIQVPNGLGAWGSRGGALGDTGANGSSSGNWGNSNMDTSAAKGKVVYVDADLGVIVARWNNQMGANTGSPDTRDFSPSNCRGWVHWKLPDTSAAREGSIGHYVRALGIQFENLKVPRHIWQRTQGFRIYYADRTHHDRRILGQNLLNPYALPEKEVTPSCKNAPIDWADIEAPPSSTDDLGLSFASTPEKFWLNLPWQLEQEAYPLPSTSGLGIEYGYQGISFHDFYLMRGHGPSGSGEARRSITAATHIKLDYIVELLAYSGPFMTRNRTDADCIAKWNSLDNLSPVITNYQTAFNFFSPSQAQEIDPPFNGGTGTNNLYEWLNINGVPPDLNRPIKERCKTYLNGDSIYNGKQLGFGYKTWNNFGESHISMLLNARYGTLPAFNLPNDLPWVKYSTAVTDVFEPQIGKASYQPFMYQANLHAFRADMYSPIDKQDLVWTGYEVTGEYYDHFKVDGNGNPIVTVVTDNLNTMTFDQAINAGLHPTFEVGTSTLNTTTGYWELEDLNNQTNPPVDDGSGVFVYEWPNWVNAMSMDDYIKTAAQPSLGNFRTGHIFGGDTFICRHGYRKTARINIVDVDGTPFEDIKRRDARGLYYTIVESTDNINFRHVENKKDSYFPGTPARDVLFLDNLVDGTDVDNMKYNEDYSSVNNVGSTVPLPIQISQPTEFPNRVIRSATSDDSSLLDNYRVFLALQFKDLPKNRGELWKISVFNNLLYFHMQDSIFRTKGKQTMKLGDASEAFIGSGDLFAQPPEELKQTEAGYGGTQSQFATVVGDFGYFYLDQRNLSVHLISDQVYDISSLGMEKWFQANLPYKLSIFGKVSYPDNPLTFGFTATYDEIFQRILLTKRELIPNENFLTAWQNWIDQEDEDPIGMIQYLPTNEAGEALGLSNAGDSFAIKIPDDPGDGTFGSGQENPWAPLIIATTPHKGNALQYFGRDGWSASYSPKLKAWISFHDYTPYKYTYTSSALYSFREHAHFGDEDSSLIHGRVWKHNYVGRKGEYYGITYKTEIEVIHNEEKFVNKLFYNFCWITDNISQGINEGEDYGGCPECGILGGTQASRIPSIDQFNNLLMTKTHHPGWEHFILYNSHQASGMVRIQELLNARKNGCEWCLNKFRDYTTRPPAVGVEAIGITGGNNTYYGLFTPQPNSLQYNDDEIDPNLSQTGSAFQGYMINGNMSVSSTPANELPLFINSDMHEVFNIAATQTNTTNAMHSPRFRPRKFVDKWLAIRLITSNYNSFLVNLYSTEVGARKFNRHERNKK
mgnify:FL=1